MRVLEITDNELVKRIIDGKKELQGELYDRYSSKVYYKCLSITKKRDIAKDLTHDIFIKLFTKLHTFSGKSDLSYWIYAITYNTCMSHLRAAKKVSSIELPENFELVDDSNKELTEKMLLELQLDQLKNVLKQLRPDDRLIILMKYQDGMSLKQISETLQLGESAVKMRLKRCRERLAELFKSLKDES